MSHHSCAGEVSQIPTRQLVPDTVSQLPGRKMVPDLFPNLISQLPEHQLWDSAMRRTKTRSCKETFGKQYFCSCCHAKRFRGSLGNAPPLVHGSPLLAKQPVASMGRSQTHPPSQTHSIDQRPSLGYRLVVWRRVGLATPVHWVRPAILGLYRRFVINTSKWSCSNYLADHILLSWTRVPAECPAR